MNSEDLKETKFLHDHMKEITEFIWNKRESGFSLEVASYLARIEFNDYKEKE